MDAAGHAASVDPAAQIVRLERRLERERAARAEAERIAEAETRALYDQARRLKLLEEVATESNLLASVEQVFSSTLRRICEFTEWPLGHVYICRETPDGPALRSARLWFARPGLEFDAFRAASEDHAFEAGVGLPGDVLRQGAAQWMRDVTEHPNFPRAPMARECGLRAAFAFPVLIGNQVAAVLEFFIDRELNPDEALLRTLDQIGAMLGRVIERDRAEAASRHAHAELQRTVVEAQAASAAKTSFLAVTSHEVRTPMNAVLGLADALSRSPMPADQKELVDGIRDAGSMLLRLLNAVLDVAKIEAGKVTLALAPCDPGPIAETIARLWRPKASETGVRIELDLSGLAEPCWIMADAGKVEQTLVNLVSNALKFTPENGRVTLRLSSWADGARRQIMAEVLDDGPGVPKADRERIFKAYEQTDEGRSAGGAGLGLTICNGNIQAMGGRIGVSPRPGRGSRFWFSFEAETCDAAAPEEAVVEGEGRSLRVLAAEDNAANRQVLKVLLGQVEIEPVFAEDGQEALDLARGGDFDLILMDANMPRMDGVTSLRHIRALAGSAAALPIFMLTANVFDEDRARYMQAGADGVLAKPIVIAELYAVLASAAARLDAAA